MKRLKELGDFMRRNPDRVTAAMEAEYEALMASVYGGKTAPVRAVLDLPMARGMWERDARELTH